MTRDEEGPPPAHVTATDGDPLAVQTSAWARRSGWFWPVGLAVLAFALSALVWFGLIAAYADLTPDEDGCGRKSAEYQLLSWIVLTASIVLFMGVTFLVAGRLRISRAVSMFLTTALMVPLVVSVAFFAFAIGTQPFCGD